MPTPCWLKHLCSIRALVPVSFFLLISLSLFPSLSFSGWSPEAQRLSEFTFLPRASKTLSRRCSAPSPHREGAWGLREQSKPHAGALLAFCVNQGISASLSFTFLSVDSRPPGSDPLKDPTTSPVSNSSPLTDSFFPSFLPRWPPASSSWCQCAKSFSHPTPMKEYSTPDLSSPAASPSLAECYLSEKPSLKIWWKVTHIFHSYPPYPELSFLRALNLHVPLCSFVFSFPPTGRSMVVLGKCVE